MTVIASDPLTPPHQPPVFALDCASCGTSYDALQAAWCQCIVKERTLVCPRCGQCFCRADVNYKSNVWISAPEALWDRKQRAAREQSPLPENPSPDSVRRPLVLVVDDDRDIRALATHLIGGWGFGCIHAANGTDGLTLARNYRPELILTDALMPKMDGRELCRLVKSDPQLAGTRVIVMSSVYTSGRFKREALSHFKADEYLAKPVDASALYRLIGPEERPEAAAGQDGIAEPSDDVWSATTSWPETREPFLSTDPANDVAVPSAAEFPVIESVPAARLRLSACDLVRLRALGLDAELAALSNAVPNLRAVDLIAARTAGVPIDFLRALDPELLATLTAADVITLHSAGCSVAAIDLLRRLEFDPREIIGIIATGVPLDFVDDVVRIAGRALSPAELVRLHAAGAEVNYIRALQECRGDEWSVDEWIRLWTLGVPPEFIRGTAEALSGECSIGDLLQLWLAGVDLALLNQVRGGI